MLQQRLLYDCSYYIWSVDCAIVAFIKKKGLSMKKWLLLTFLLSSGLAVQAEGEDEASEQRTDNPWDEVTEGDVKRNEQESWQLAQEVSKFKKRPSMLERFRSNFSRSSDTDEGSLNLLGHVKKAWSNIKEFVKRRVLRQPLNQAYGSKQVDTYTDSRGLVQGSASHQIR